MQTRLYGVLNTKAMCAALISNRLILFLISHLNSQIRFISFDSMKFIIWNSKEITICNRKKHRVEFCQIIKATCFKREASFQVYHFSSIRHSLKVMWKKSVYRNAHNESVIPQSCCLQDNKVNAGFKKTTTKNFTETILKCQPKENKWIHLSSKDIYEIHKRTYTSLLLVIKTTNDFFYQHFIYLSLLTEHFYASPKSTCWNPNAKVVVL